MQNEYAPARRLSAAARALIASIVALTVTAAGSLTAVSLHQVEWTPGGASSGGTVSSGSTVHPPVNEHAPEVTLQSAGGTALSNEEIANKVRPSVVGIVAQKSGSDGYSEGSGVVLTADGYILTNAHVVSSDDGTAASLLVIDCEGNRYNAEVVGFDSRTDVAAIRVTDADAALTPAEFADSATAQVGDPVLVAGNPGGQTYANSVTHGMISAVNRVVSSNINVFGLFQVDAAINPGNSGGALVNQYGQVIGINCAKVAAEGYEGIGFAIPMTKVQSIFNTLLKYGYVKDRVYLGVSFSAVTAVNGAAEQLPLGMRVMAFASGTVFARADVRTGDIITAVNGTKVTDSGIFYEILYHCTPQELAEFTIYRPNGATGTGQTFTVKVPLLGGD